MKKILITGGAGYIGSQLATDLVLKKYQVNKKLMKAAKSDAIFMHCLPASREEEVTSEVMDGKQSVVWLQAFNRIHAQKSIIEWCIK